MKNNINKQFDKFTDLPDEMYMLYFKNIHGKWTLNSTIFITRDMAEYIGSFYDGPTWIIPVKSMSPERLTEEQIEKQKSKWSQNQKIKKVRMPKIKVPKTKIPKIKKVRT